MVPIVVVPVASATAAGVEPYPAPPVFSRSPSPIIRSSGQAVVGWHGKAPMSVLDKWRRRHWYCTCTCMQDAGCSRLVLPPQPLFDRFWLRTLNDPGAAASAEELAPMRSPGSMLCILVLVHRELGLVITPRRSFLCFYGRVVRYSRGRTKGRAMPPNYSASWCCWTRWKTLFVDTPGTTPVESGLSRELRVCELLRLSTGGEEAPYGWACSAVS